jgi:hypothetical protein
MYKLVVFVPLSHLSAVRSAVCAAGAGRTGKYDNCSFYSIGTGTFRPLTGAKPYIGRNGKLSKVKEARLEVLVPERSAKKIVAALKKAHPYEEPAFELYPFKKTG